MVVDFQQEGIHTCQSLSVTQRGLSAGKNHAGCSRQCLELPRESSCDSSPSHAQCCFDLGSDLVCATHHYLVLVTAVDSDLVDKIVNEIIGVVVYTSTGVDSGSSRHFAWSRSHQSSPLKLVFGHAFTHLLGNTLQLLRQGLLVPSSLDWSQTRQNITHTTQTTPRETERGEDGREEDKTQDTRHKTQDTGQRTEDRGQRR